MTVSDVPFRRAAPVAALAWCVATGCVLSVDAVIPPGGGRVEERLLGDWRESDGSDRVTITRTGNDAYAVAYTDAQGAVAHFAGRLDSLGGRLVLEVAPVPERSGMSDAYAATTLAGHLLFAVTMGSDEIALAPIDPDSLLADLRAGAVPLTFSVHGDQLVLHGTTAELRPALASWIARRPVPGDATVWRRADPAAPDAAAADTCMMTAAWPEADALFRRDPYWVGSDGAYSVDLGGGRSLWLFGDTWIDTTGHHTRRGGRMIRNSVAIQIGADPSEAAITFHWGRNADGGPGPFFPSDGRHWFWPAHGIRLGDRLLLFLIRLLPTETGLGFEADGWNAVLVDNPDEPPTRWRRTTLDTPRSPLGVTVGSGGVLGLGEYVYAFGAQEPVKSHPVFLARWPTEDARRGKLETPEWWGGPHVGWVPDTADTARWPVFENGQTELTVHFDHHTGLFLAFQTVGFGPADVAVRSAPALTGPWTAARTVHRPAEHARPNVMIYAAKAHPQLAGGAPVLTYATNTFAFAEQFTDSLIYYPRFLRVRRCALHD